MPSFKIIGLLVLQKIFKGFYHIWAWQPSWSCDLDHLYKLLFPLPKKAPNERATCIRQGFLTPLKPKIESYFTTFFWDCFIRGMTKVFILHIYSTLPVAMVTENCRQYTRLK